jgi:hypothetical protein
MKRQPCLVFLLRLWRDEPEDEEWRATLESASTGKRYGFPTLEGLCAWIREGAEGAGEDAAQPYTQEQHRQPSDEGSGEAHGPLQGHRSESR